MRLTAIRGLAAFGPAFIEQPVAPGDLRGHARLSRARASRSSPTSRSTPSTTSSAIVRAGRRRRPERVRRQGRRHGAGRACDAHRGRVRHPLDPGQQRRDGPRRRRPGPRRVRGGVAGAVPVSDIIGHHYYDEDILEHAARHRRRRGATARRARASASSRRRAIRGALRMIVDVHTHTPSHRDAVPEAEQVVNTAWRPDRPSWPAPPGPTTTPRSGRAAWTSRSSSTSRPARRAAPGVVVDLARVNDSTADFVGRRPGTAHRLLLGRPGGPGRHGRARALRRRPRAAGASSSGPNYQDFEPLGRARAARLRLGRAARPADPVPPGHVADPDGAAALRPSAGHGRDRHRLPGAAHRDGAPRPPLAGGHDRGHPQASHTSTPTFGAGFYRPWSFYNALRLATEWGVLPKLLLGLGLPGRDARARRSTACGA